MLTNSSITTKTACLELSVHLKAETHAKNTIIVSIVRTRIGLSFTGDTMKLPLYV
jgi:hypothetical protein